jgi:hypothetical protein
MGGRMIMTPDATLLEPLLGKARQLGYVVRDLDAAMSFWTQMLDVGPFVVIEEAVGNRDYLHRGVKSDVQMSLAFTYCGDVQFELVQQINDAPSPYMEFLGEGREGLHHIAFYPDDYEQARAELLRRGMEEVACVQTLDGERQNSFFATPPEVGFMIELTPVTPEREHYYSGFRKLTETWDGTRPVRRYKNRAEYVASEDCKV